MEMTLQQVSVRGHGDEGLMNRKMVQILYMHVWLVFVFMF